MGVCIYKRKKKKIYKCKPVIVFTPIPNKLWASHPKTNIILGKISERYNPSYNLKIY